MAEAHPDLITSRTAQQSNGLYRIGDQTKQS
jgi:hypothetical protein